MLTNWIVWSESSSHQINFRKQPCGGERRKILPVLHNSTTPSMKLTCPKEKSTFMSNSSSRFIYNIFYSLQCTSKATTNSEPERGYRNTNSLTIQLRLKTFSKMIPPCTRWYSDSHQHKLVPLGTHTLYATLYNKLFVPCSRLSHIHTSFIPFAKYFEALLLSKWFYPKRMINFSLASLASYGITPLERETKPYLLSTQSNP